MYTCVCVCIYMYICIYVYMYICIYVYIYTYMCVCVCVCVCIYINGRREGEPQKSGGGCVLACPARRRRGAVSAVDPAHGLCVTYYLLGNYYLQRSRECY